ncbi:hypothetical protein LIER_41652 [Lithospermum erythrorhizon]|uniref:RRM domain-containing protein n=1 Tax=Lithospermum erythrorhizon TaxID=34254 RepID=A0AAV3RG05_LITER
MGYSNYQSGFTSGILVKCSRFVCMRVDYSLVLTESTSLLMPEDRISMKTMKDLWRHSFIFQSDFSKLCLTEVGFDEYVIVLLKNGRRKDEAKNELDVFLGDDSESFITWLWDHLGSSLHLYSKSLSMQSEEVGDVQPAVQAAVGKNGSLKMESESEEGRYKLSKSSHRRKWKGLVGDMKEHQILKSSIGEIDPLKDNIRKKVNSVKPRDSLHEGAQRKRFRTETCGSNKVISISEAQGSSKGGVQQALNTAPRRLLQFAVRDAVATSRPPISVTKPSLKRIRPVVSSASEDTALDESLETRRPVTRMSSMSTVIKAVAEAAEDVTRLGPSRNVFYRLGRSTDVPDILEQPTSFVEDIPEDRYHSKMDVHSSYHNNLKEQYVSDTALFPSYTEMALVSRFEYDGYNDMEIRGGGSNDISLSSEVIREKLKDTLMFPYDAANNADGREQKLFSPVSVPDALHKIVTWKSPQYREAREDGKLSGNKFKVENKALTVKLNVPLKMANKKPTVHGNGNVKSEAGIVQESHKMQSSTHGAYSTAPPTDDSDSRTIFVSNVHFAATKDSLSRHFNKFGDVLKVIILSDPATGLQKGSAYVVFVRKEAAGDALSLDGTSFLSRILKVYH